MVTDRQSVNQYNFFMVNKTFKEHLNIKNYGVINIYFLIFKDRQSFLVRLVGSIQNYLSWKQWKTKKKKASIQNYLSWKQWKTKKQGKQDKTKERKRQNKGQVKLQKKSDN